MEDITLTRTHQRYSRGLYGDIYRFEGQRYNLAVTPTIEW